MKRFEKILAMAITVCLLNIFLPFSQLNVFAAPIPINIYVDDFSNGDLNIRWDNVAGTKSFRISYHMPDGGSQTIEINDSVNKYTITGLDSDFIYDIRVELLNNSASVIAEGLLFFLPGITFMASRVEQTRTALPGGGFEIGDKPRLNLKWMMPKVWNGGGVVNAGQPGAVTYIKNSLNSVYGNGLDITSLNFRINISTNAGNLNSGSSQSAIIIEYSASGYTAHVSGNDSVKASVLGPDSNGYMSVDLIGRKDANAEIPPLETNGLPDGDILPGTVYYMNIKPAFYNDAKETKYAVTVGKPSDMNGSILSGSFPYTYTPIRFQLSRDSSNNIYVKVYKVNQGSLNMPRMFYEIQSSDDPTIPGDWTVRKTLDDSFFVQGSDSALTVISGTGQNNTIYYRIVVKTETSIDRIESGKLPYALGEDSSKWSVPSGITIVDRELVTRKVIDANGKEVLQKSSNITISWEKPANWNEIKTNTDTDKDMVFHVLLNTSQKEITTEPYPELRDDDTSYGYFPLKYRRVIYFSSKAVKEVGNRLEYTIKGFELFKGEYFTGYDAGGNPVIVEESIDNTEGYPDFLLPNKVYYMQMYTTSAANRNTTNIEEMSDKSVIVSFTTRAAQEMDVPLPKNFVVTKNDANVTIDQDTQQVIVSNYIELQFDKLNINWKNYVADTSVSKAVYYDLYMSTRTDITSFKFVGSTENPKGDVLFVGTNDDSSSIRATISNFSPGTDGYTLFGEKLRPNTTYYFVIKTRLSISTLSEDKISKPSAILAVTTVRGVMGEPDESAKRPLTPTDFNIAKDQKGNPLVDSLSVVFSWNWAENDVYYEIICTSRRVEPNEGDYDGSEDAIYQSFNAEFGNVILDPSLPVLAKNFELDPLTKQLRYTVDSWLFPNRLYYFSIRAVKSSDPTNYSLWVSIPVTTILIEQPSMLEAVKDAQLGFYFNDSDINARTEDYSIYIKPEDDLKFGQVARNRYTIVRLGAINYVRLSNLEFDTAYDINVYKKNKSEPVFTAQSLKTRDGGHELEAKWRGLPGYKYELAIKTLADDDYIELSDEDLEEYINYDGKILPYYKEKDPKANTMNYEYFYARIKTYPVKMQDGSIKHEELKSNTKYYIKVRAVRIDPVDSTIVSYSKYIGPVEVRTEFNQDDYDEEDNNNKKEAKFLDKIREFEEALYWRIDIRNGNYNKLLLKEDRMVNAIQNNGPYPFTLDISNINEGAGTDVVYVPGSVIEVLETDNTSLVIKTIGAEYTLRPGTIDTESKEVVALHDNSNVKGIYYKFTIKRLQKSAKSLPEGAEAASQINSVSLEAVGTSFTYSQIRDEIHNKLYNKESGLVQEKLNKLLSRDNKKSKYTNIDEEILELIGEIEEDLSVFIKNRIDTTSGSYSIVVGTKVIKDFDKPMMTKLTFTDKPGLKTPGVWYEGEGKWKKLSSNTVYIGNSALFNTIKTGEYAVLVFAAAPSDVPDGYSYSGDIKILMSKYDLRDVFGNLDSFYPEDNVKVKEAILLYEKVTNKEGTSHGLTISQKAEKYGLKSLVGVGGVTRDITRQEIALIIMKVYCEKTGVNIQSLIPKRYVYISDERDVDSSLLKPVLLVLDLEVMTVGENGAFGPKKPVTRAELVESFVKILEITKEI
ncbi:MAG TPA: S-layer homology domain-containing protein [Acetivibrio sp.]|uniref:S-layer homology domain-containing protein n=1 Tax=Acetivibrio sp. TaxID=1872092 RepID=UPI002B551F94|nr:S-layer homology domain-containing protein [Acetivibrio sp.]HOM02824.1 S-layer homology domain-containing protein [Acetivibrio sp.]